MTQLIKIIYSLNGIDSSISFDPFNKLSVLKNLINLTQKINLDEYELSYGKKLISWNEEKSIKDIVAKELVPVFIIKKKSNAKQEVLTAKSSEQQSVYKAILTIDNLPSRVEIISLTDKFFEEINLPKDYHIDHSGSSIEIKFKNPVI